SVGEERGRVDRRVYRDGRSVPRAQRWTCVQAQRSVLVSGRNRRPSRNGSLLERYRRQRRPGERVRLVQGQMGIVLADYADRPDECDPDPDPAAAKRAFDAMMQMKKITSLQSRR